MEYQIIDLPKEKWENTLIPIGYTTEEYYNITMEKKADGFVMEMKKQSFTQPVTHTPQEYDFPDRLYEPHWEKACARGIVQDKKLMAVVETAPEEWSNRLRVTELWVDESLRGKGIGHALMETAKEQARREGRRVLMLETQSCNVNAIGFYLHEGFTLIGFDSCCYRNNDLDRKEVRVELGWFLQEKK